MNKNVAVLSGDGFGAEIIEQAVKVIKVIELKFNHHFQYNYAFIGAAAIDKTENSYPDEQHELCQSCDAILFGAIINAVNKCLQKNFVTEDIHLGKYSTSQVGDKIIESILA